MSYYMKNRLRRVQSTSYDRFLGFSSGIVGNKASFGLVVNVLIWLVVFVIAFFLYRFFKGLIPGRTPLAPISDDLEKEISERSKDRLNNGDTYLDAVRWLYSEMYGDTILGWWKNSDEDLIGRYLLTIKPSEYKQLSNTYNLYKKDHGFWQIGALKDSLTTDLLDLFSSGNQKKYLSHLGVL